MFVKRLITLMALLSFALGTSAALGAEQHFTGAGQTTLSAAPSPGDCNACQDCAKPCVTAIACSTSCVPTGAGFVIQASAMYAGQGRFAAKPEWQASSAELRTPTPPPKLSHIA
jgi:hypothetical protein